MYLLEKKIFVNSDKGKAQIVDVFLNNTLYDQTSGKTACEVHYTAIKEVGVLNKSFDKIEFFTYVGYWEINFIKNCLT
ncbi:hypothetical protein HWD03_gp099 [Alteromonas phage vB_AmeM_PT11-V22]|uniref:Uncharacterized protein n=1 Tax=Alteromonas phage vB_AmeM_PT11-V22 TaxID=2704031 RepID=A0A6C0R0N3_9CAUD|nr:hypothetical protein HWD03_gp099 [Alteromonas phage vB_AmeM_PT11-V22]QHZ59779.1 hypothetical protein [Alteromonas phage vB_AmeM_PT11-V22]